MVLRSHVWLALGLLGIWLLSGTSSYAACSGPVGSEVGKCAPDFSLTDLQGRKVRLSSLSGKVVFLNFWATWCAPCAREMPDLHAIGKELKGKPFVMLAVSVDAEGKSAIDPFLSKLFGSQLPDFEVLLDPKKEIASRYGTFKFPETYIIDREGKVRNKVVGVREWRDDLILSYLTLLSGG